MTTLGMDTAAGLAASGSLDEGSQRIAELATLIDGALRSFEWTGTDAERTLETWQASGRPSLDRTVDQLGAIALLIRQEAQAQDTASGTTAGTTAGTAASTAAATPAVAPGGPAPGTPTPTGTRGLLDGRLADAFAGAARTAGHAGDLLGKIGDVLTGREPHSIAEIAGAAIGTVGSGVGTVLDAFDDDAVDRRWFAEGAGAVGAPTPVPLTREPGSATPPLTRPDSLSALMHGVTDAYAVGKDPSVEGGDIRITRVDNGGGSTPGYVVQIPGTESWGPGAGTEPRDLSANVALVAGQPTAAAETVRRALDAAGIPPGSPVMLVGHSQGGIIAATLASDPAFVERYGVTHVLTYGSPVDHLQLAPGVDALAVQHRFDVVPRLDLGGVDGSGTNPNTPVPTVTLDSPGGVLGPVRNHDHTLYSGSVATAMGGDSEAGRTLRDYQSRLGAFIVTPTGSVSGVDVPVSRRP
ncbi:hypothetical protein [Nocardioides litoris]|uniref:PGAP1-like alpha/beta domain-containing protein n=1 Tax=Nocardioides litoris TaxID=1926648 RepID=UPI00112084C2|nr:hypothetical protein [Nocardioides litoris]